MYRHTYLQHQDYHQTSDIPFEWTTTQNSYHCVLAQTIYLKKRFDYGAVC